MATVHRPLQEHGDALGHAATETAQLLMELRASTDLIWLVERVTQTKLPWVVIPAAAIAAWEASDRAGWEKVSDWLAVRGVAIVRI